MVVDVPVDRQRASIGKRLKETLDLTSQLQPDLRPQPGRSGAGNSMRPHAQRSSIEAAAMVDQQVHFARRRQWDDPRRGSDGGPAERSGRCRSAATACSQPAPLTTTLVRRSQPES